MTPLEFLSKNKIHYTTEGCSIVIEGTQYKKSSLRVWSKNGALELNRNDFLWWLKHNVSPSAIRKYTCSYLDDMNISSGAGLQLHEKFLVHRIRIKKLKGETYVLEDMDGVFESRQITRDCANRLLKSNLPRNYIFEKHWSHKRDSADLESAYSACKPERMRLYNALGRFGIRCKSTESNDWVEVVVGDAPPKRISMHMLKKAKAAADLGMGAEDVVWILSQESCISHEHPLFEMFVKERIPYSKHKLFEIILSKLPGAKLKDFDGDVCTLTLGDRSIRGQSQFIRARVAAYHDDHAALFTPQNCLRTPKIQKFVEDILKQHDISFISNDRSIISPLEIDILIPDLKLGFECNGVAYHSENGVYRGRASDYHKHKQDKAREAGIELYHLCESDIYHKPDIIKAYIETKIKKNITRVYARNTSISKINNKDAREFHEKYHIQGHAPSKMHYAIRHDGQTLAVLSLSPTRKFLNRVDEHTFEVVRFTCKAGHLVIGGLSKAIKHACRAENIHHIHTFVDKNMHNGNGYVAAGFKYIRDTPPGYSYIDASTFKKYHRSSFQKHILTKKYPELADMSEADIMAKLRHFKVWNCGNLYLEYTNNDSN